jgi:hypothetical protein
MTPPANHNGSFTLAVDAVVTDSAMLSTGPTSHTTTVTQHVAVTVLPVNDAPSVAFAAGDNHLLSSSNGYVVGRPTPQSIQLSDLGISGDSAITVEFWFNGNGDIAQVPFGFYLYDLMIGDFDSGIGRAIGFNSGGGDLYGIKRTDLDGQWHHIAAVFDNGNVHDNKLYIDGTLQTLTQLRASPLNGNATLSNTAQIGGIGFENTYSIGGKVDEVRIWHGERAAADIAAGMNGIATGQQTGLIAAYSFEFVQDGIGGVHDSSGNDLDGTLSGWTAANNFVLDSTLSLDQSVTEDHELVFSCETGNAITVGDADSAELTVTLTVDNGSLTLATTDDLTDFSGNGSGCVTLSGSAASINAALDGLVYSPDQDYAGSDSLSIIVSDGGEDDAAKTIDITVNSVNDAPVALGEVLNGSVAGFTYDATNGHWYSINTTALLRADASAAAVAAGGYLATITSLAENTFISNLVGSAGLNQAYIGGTDSVTEGVWRWDGGPEAGVQFWSGGPAPGGFALGYANWNGPEPNNFEAHLGGEDFIYITKSGGATGGTWVDFPYSNAPDKQQGSVIEVSFVEDTESVIPAAFLLANDTDVDGDPRQIYGFSSGGAQTGATNGGGSVELLANGNILYTPDEDFSGLDSFGYFVTDGNGGISAMVHAIFYVSPGEFQTVTMNFNGGVEDVFIPSGYGASGPFDGLDFHGATYAHNNDNVTLGMKILSGGEYEISSVDNSEFFINSFTIYDMFDGVPLTGLSSIEITGFNNGEAVWSDFFTLDPDLGDEDVFEADDFPFVPLTSIKFNNTDIGAAGVIDNFTIITQPSVRGTDGAEFLYATNLGNRVIGYEGNDTLTGDVGADVFVFHPGSGQDTIISFDLAPGKDKIELFGLGPDENDFSELAIGENELGHATVAFGDTDVITLVGVSQEQLLSSHFVLHSAVLT